MPVKSTDLHVIPTDSIQVPERQRTELGDISELADSISRYGQLHPIVCRRNNELVAGERRLRACKELQVPVRVVYIDELDDHEVRAVELEENVRRLNMTWEERARAIVNYHSFRKNVDPEWTQEMTSDALGLPRKGILKATAVVEAIDSGWTSLSECQNISTAYNMVKRKEAKALDDELASFLEAEEQEEGEQTQNAERKGSLNEFFEKMDLPEETFEPQAPVQEAYIEKDYFVKFYHEQKRRFNVLHIDFPFGISQHESKQSGSARWGKEMYEDSEHMFSMLCMQMREAIEEHDLLMDTAHMIFWYPAAKYAQAVEAIESFGFKVNPTPNIWFKSDSTGILPDPNRGPRQVYEPCLLASRGDRKIVRAVNNVIAHPASRHKSLHPSEKPISVVEHFLRMVVDEYARVLDPTCGSGTAVAAAYRLGAKLAVGVEPIDSHVETARRELNRVKLEASVG